MSGLPSGPGGQVPDSAAPYKRTPEFTEETVPAGLLREHSTRAGVWGVITVTSGTLRYVIPSTGVDARLDPETPGIVVPEQLHYVAPLGSVSFYVEFWR
ncbi:MAG: DUF1971 domain-containing protein [Pseudomonadota bacterium]